MHRTTSNAAIRALAFASTLVLAAGCDNSAGPRDEVAVRISVAASSDQQVTAAQQGGALVLTGTNGVLQLDELFVIMERFRLKRADNVACADDDDDHDDDGDRSAHGDGDHDGDDDDGDDEGEGEESDDDEGCERFSAPPALLDLPLDGSSVIAVRQPIPDGTYREVRFEINDVDSDHGEDRELLTAIRAKFPDWPKDASLLAVGTFTPTGGTPIPFRAYFEAEVEVRFELSPPFVADSEEGGVFTVNLDPMLLFRVGNGEVRDLSAVDFATTGRVPRIEVELGNGFTRIEFGR